MLAVIVKDEYVLSTFCIISKTLLNSSSIKWDKLKYGDYAQHEYDR